MRKWTHKTEKTATSRELQELCSRRSEQRYFDKYNAQPKLNQSTRKGGY